MSAIAAARDYLQDQITPAVVQAKLRAMAAMLNLKPSLRHHLKDVHPTGKEFVFEATIEFVTDDRRKGAHAVFAGGKMHVRSGPANHADVTVRFRRLEHMRAFFGGGDVFHMLLENTLVLEGNLSYLFKFGHLSAVIALGGEKKSRIEAKKNGIPADWRDLKPYPTGEPCTELPAGEVTHLREPYLAAYSLDDFPRIKRLLWDHRRAEPALCSERPRLLTDYVLTEGARESFVVLKQAGALCHILKNRQAIIHDHDLLAGTTTAQGLGVLLFPELGGTGIWGELLTCEARELNPYRVSREAIDILNRQVFPFWMTENVRDWTKAANDNPEVLKLDERFVFYFMWKTQAASHTVIDVPRVLARGIRDLQREAAERERGAADDDTRAFYAAVQLALEGVVLYAGHLAERADARLEEVEGDDAEAQSRREVLRDMASTCRKVPAGPASSLREALQAIWILLVAQHQESMNAGLAVGRLDTWLQPYLEHDLAAARDTGERGLLLERALELVCAFMLKLTDHLPLVPDVGNRLFGGSSENQVITLGGLTQDGASAVCDMTWIFLKATEMLHLRDPNINARFAPGVNSEAYLQRLCEVNLLTRATPSLHNDNAMVPALIEQGFSEEDARDWTATGCVEPTVCGRHFGHTNCMMLNIVAPLEMALRDGVHPLMGTRLGPTTGEADSFSSYEEFFAAYRAQLGWLIDRSVEANNMLGRTHQAIKPTPLLSGLFTGPMDKGKDVVDGGALYNTSGAAMIGLTDVIDSLCTIKELVFARQRFTLSELLAVLDVDFEGHEKLLVEILHKVPKFGQENGLPQQIAREIIDFIFLRFQSHDNYRGGLYLPGYWSMSNHVAFGTLSGALPSGRRKGKAFTPGLTPSHLAGAALTSQIRAVANLDSVKMPNNIAFNVKVVPGAEDTHREVRERMAAYVASYFDLGGMQMQFNVMSTDTLRAAMESPEEYRDLLVRISGYNAYFVELNRDIQLELIERAEHGLGMQSR